MIQIMTKAMGTEGGGGGDIEETVEQTMLQSYGIKKKAPCFSEELTNLVLGLLKEITRTEEQEEIYGQ